MMMCSQCLAHHDLDALARLAITCKCDHSGCSCPAKSNVRLVTRDEALLAYTRLLVKHHRK